MNNSNLERDIFDFTGAGDRCDGGDRGDADDGLDGGDGLDGDDGLDGGDEGDQEMEIYEEDLASSTPTSETEEASDSQKSYSGFVCPSVLTP